MSSVFHTYKKENYTPIDNLLLRDKRLSLKALGLMCCMLSFPPGWHYSINGLKAIRKEGDVSIRSTLNELIKLGYVERVRIFDKFGKFAGFDYSVYENPCLKKTCVGNPVMENPVLENPVVENPARLNNDKIKYRIDKRKNKFSDFQQNDYDMAALEELLVSNVEVNHEK